MSELMIEFKECCVTGNISRFTAVRRILHGEEKESKFHNHIIGADPSCRVVLIPSFSDYWNSFHQSRAIATYSDAVEQLDAEDYETFWQEAVEYNERMAAVGNRFSLSEDEEEEYNKLLNITGRVLWDILRSPVPAARCRSIMVQMKRCFRLQQGILRELLFL